MPELRGQLFTMAEVAKLLDVTRATVAYWIEQHALSPIRSPRGVRIRYVDLERFAAPLVGAGTIPVPDDPILLPTAMSALLSAERFDKEASVRPFVHYTTLEAALDHVLLDARLRLGPLTRVNDPFESEPLWATLSLIGGAPKTAGRSLVLVQEISRLLRDPCRLLCLGRSGPSEWTSLIGFGDGYARARMWAQYADNHAGVCLAFDQARLRAAMESLANARGLRLYRAPVRYFPEIERNRGIHLRLTEPVRGLKRRIDRLFPGVVGQLYFEKAWDWCTEYEYRFLLHGDVADFEYIDISDSLTGIFCGPKFPDARLGDLVARCPELVRENRVFRIRWHNGVARAHPVAVGLSTTTAGWKLPPPPAEPSS